MSLKTRFILGMAAIALLISVLWVIWHIIWLGVSLGDLLRFWYAYLLFLLSLMLPLWLALDRWVLRALAYLTWSNAEVTRGNLEEATIPDGNIPKSDMGDMIRSHNAMLDSLVSSRRQVEAENEALRTVSERLQHVLATNPAVTYVCNAAPGGGPEDGYPPTYVSDNIVDIFGYGPEECIGDPGWWFEHIHPDDAPDAVARISRLFEEGRLSHEYRFRNRAGRWRWVHDDLILVRDAAGNSVEFVGSWSDITERRQTEHTLRESEEIFRAITGSAQDAMIMLNNEGNICYWNESAERIFGYPAQVAVGQDLHGLIVPQRYHSAWRDGFVEFRKSGIGPAIGKVLELEAVRRGGAEFPVELSLASVKLKGTWHAVGIIRDITERKRMEAALQQNERDRVLMETAGAAAHEINQPLAVISGLAQILLGTTPEEDPHREDFREIHEGTKRIQDILMRMEHVRKYDTKSYVGSAKIVDFDRTPEDG